METRETLIALNLIPGLGAAMIHRLLAAFDSPEAIFRASPILLEEILRPHAKPDLIDRIAMAMRGTALSQELDRAKTADVQIVTLFDSDYPQGLRTIFDPPPVLYVKGNLIPEDSIAVAIVGTRSASAYGLTTARQFAQGLVQSGITVVSGLAEGIDRAAHEGALEENGRTIAVLGNGLSTVYPPQHEKLAHQIAESGALVSEFPMQMEPSKENFPRRNRVIAGLSLGVMVVEAPIRSGALITAREALEQGRELFAVPGPISSVRSRGCHRLIKEGAKLVEQLSDLLEELAPRLKEKLGEWKSVRPEPFDSAVRAELVEAERRDQGRLVEGQGPLSFDRLRMSGGGAGLSSEESTLYESIPVAGAAQVDALLGETPFNPSRLLGLLTSLELKGLVRQIPGQGYSRTGWTTGVNS